MPRKKVTGPATAEQVLDYFESAGDVEVRLVASLVEGRLKKRFAPQLSATRATTGSGEANTRKPRKAKAAPDTYGELGPQGRLGEA